MNSGFAATDGRQCTRAPHAQAAPGRQVLDITVLMGGPSTERDVSLVSGAAVAAGLARCGHRVTHSDISPTDASALDRKGIDVVFIALHGSFGESGDVQQLCEDRNLRYTGSSQAASRVAMDKHLSKLAFRDAGLATADWTVVQKTQSADQRASLLGSLGLPVVVKPVDGGSSVDTTVARDAATRDAAIESSLAKYGQVMVERFVAGREFTVGILGDRALPSLEIVSARSFYDYTAKYADGSGTQYLFDRLGQQEEKQLRQLAMKAYRCLGCRDMSRVDFIIDAQGVAQVLEINTIPGFTGHSLLPMAAAKVGIGFDQLVNHIVETAMRR